jgi:hypothetical protein
MGWRRVSDDAIGQSTRRVKMMRKARWAAVVATGLLVAAVPGSQARETFDATVTVVGGENYEDGDIVFGDVEAVRRCRENRRIQLQIDDVDMAPRKRGQGFEVVDSGRTSASGSWALFGDFSVAQDARVKLPAKRLPNGDRCAAATEGIST